jgi:hypothetical protein
MGWYQRLLRRADRARARPPTRPALEALEDRAVPSAWGSWEGLGGVARQIVGYTNGVDLSSTPTVFAIGGDNAVYCRTLNNGVWGAWQGLGGFATQIAVTTFGDNSSGHNFSADLFALGPDGAVYHRSQDSGGVWGPWQGLGGFAYQIAVEETPTGSGGWQADLFVIGGDHALYHRALPDGGAPGIWEGLGGNVIQITVAQNGVNRNPEPVVYAIGPDHAVYRHAVNAAAIWEGLGGFATQIAVGGVSGVDWVYALGPDHALYVRDLTTAWHWLGGYVNQIAASAHQPTGVGEYQNGVELVAVGADQGAYHVAAGVGWEGLGGNSVAVAVTTSFDGTDGPTDLFTIGTDGAVYHRGSHA